MATETAPTVATVTVTADSRRDLLEKTIRRQQPVVPDER